MTRPSRWLAAVVAGSILVGLAGWFLPAQCLWVDETAQLAGLKLGPRTVVSWLAGRSPGDPGQLRDRMPPGSYWAGQLWGAGFGLGEASLRWFGVACVALASAIVAATARRIYGSASGWVAGLLSATAPMLVVTAVEIRAYPLYLLLSSLATALLLVWVDPNPDPTRPTPRWVVPALMATLVGGMVVHHLGTNLAGAVIVAAWFGLGRDRPRRRELLTVTVVVMATGLALLSFVRAAAAMGSRQSPSVPMTARWEAVAKLVPLLMSHPSLMVVPSVEVLLLVSLGVLGVLACRVRPPASRTLVTLLGAGFVAVTIVELGFARPRFNVCAPTYSMWARPALILIAASGLASPGRWSRRIAAGAAMVAIGCQVIGIGVLETHRDHFAHGPHARIAALIREADPSRVAVIHDTKGSMTLYVANPLRSEFGPGLAQFHASRSGAPDSLIVVPESGATRPLESLRGRTLVVVRSRLVGEHELADQVRRGDRPIAPGPWVESGAWRGHWRHVRTTQQVAAVAARIDLFEPID